MTLSPIELKVLESLGQDEPFTNINGKADAVVNALVSLENQNLIKEYSLTLKGKRILTEYKKAE